MLTEVPFSEVHCPIALVSRYAAFPEVAYWLGIVGGSVPYFARPHAEDVRGHHVVCDQMDLQTAANAAVVTVLPIKLPKALDNEDAALDVLVKYAGKPQTYIVRGSSASVLGQYNGGITPLAALMAHSLINHFAIRDLDPDALAMRLDALLLDERQAGAETEKLLLRMLGAARDRNVILEAQGIASPVNGEAATG